MSAEHDDMRRRIYQEEEIRAQARSHIRNRRLLRWLVPLAGLGVAIVGIKIWTSPDVVRKFISPRDPTVSSASAELGDERCTRILDSCSASEREEAQRPGASATTLSAVWVNCVGELEAAKCPE